jgi:hypothetical protein
MMLAIVQMADATGPVTLRASAAGLPEAACQIGGTPA